MNKKVFIIATLIVMIPMNVIANTSREGMHFGDEDYLHREIKIKETELEVLPRETIPRAVSNKGGKDKWYTNLMTSASDKIKNAFKVVMNTETGNQTLDIKDDSKADNTASPNKREGVSEWLRFPLDIDSVYNSVYGFRFIGGRSLPPAVVTACSGHPDVKGFNDFHSGLDLHAPLGTPVYAAFDGTVEASRSQMGDTEYWVRIKHDYQGRSIHTAYFHLSSVVIQGKVINHGGGQVNHNVKVKEGDLIGYSGPKPGGVYAPHLHFEVHVNSFGEMRSTKKNDGCWKTAMSTEMWGTQWRDHPGIYLHEMQGTNKGDAIKPKHKK